MTNATVTMPLMTLNPSGGVRMALSVTNQLASNGVRVEVVAPDYAADPPVDLHPDIALSIVDTGAKRLRRLHYLRHLVRRLMRQNGIFIAADYQTPLLIHTARLPRRSRTLRIIQNDDSVAHIRYGSQPGLLKPLLYAAAEIGYRLPGYKIAVSRYVADRVSAHVDEIVHPGIAPEFFAGERASSSGEPAVIGIFPTQEEVKGTPFAVHALEDLRREGLRAQFLVFDRDYATDHVPDFIERFSVFAKARGIDVDVPTFYRSCDIFIFPSLVEGFGLPPIEAMASGAAVVLSDSGGVMDYARDRVNCMVVPPADPHAIRRAARLLIEDIDLRRKLVTEGHRTARQFTEERFARRCAAIVMDLLQSGPPGAEP